MKISPQTRNAGLYVLGFAGITVELLAWAVLNRTPDPSLTFGFFGILGLPSMLNSDEKK